MPGRHQHTRLLASLALAAGFTFGPTAVSHASGVTVTDLTNGVTATQLAQSLAGSGVSISNVTYTGDNRAAGSFTGGAGNVGFPSGIGLSSGYVQTHGTDSPCSRGVEGPNPCYEGGLDGGDNTAEFLTPGDSDLNTLSGGTSSGTTVTAPAGTT